MESPVNHKNQCVCGCGCVRMRMRLGGCAWVYVLCLRVCVCVCVVCVRACVWVCVLCLCVCLSVCVLVYMFTRTQICMTWVLQCKHGLWGHFLCPCKTKGLKNIQNRVLWNSEIANRSVRARPAVCAVVLEVQRDSCGSDPVTDSSCVWDAANAHDTQHQPTELQNTWRLYG